jgi:hypothetical protein
MNQTTSKSGGIIPVVVQSPDGKYRFSCFHCGTGYTIEAPDEEPQKPEPKKRKRTKKKK